MNTTTTTTSQKYTLGLRDVIKSLVVAVLTPVFTVLIQTLQNGSLTFDWKAIGVTALVAALGYIAKNFLSPARIIIEAPSDTVQAVKEGDAKVTVR